MNHSIVPAYRAVILNLAGIRDETGFDLANAPTPGRAPTTSDVRSLRNARISHGDPPDDMDGPEILWKPRCCLTDHLKVSHDSIDHTGVLHEGVFVHRFDVRLDLLHRK